MKLYFKLHFCSFIINAGAEIVCNGDGTSATVTLKDKDGTKQTITCATSDKNVGKAMTGFGGLGTNSVVLFKITNTYSTKTLTPF